MELENKTETQEQFTIPKSGLAVNKYITGKIDGLNCDITLFSKIGSCPDLAHRLYYSFQTSAFFSVYSFSYLVNHFIPS